MSAIVLIGAGACILLLGVGLGYWWGTVGRRQEADKASDLQQELDDYRRNVTEHFKSTAEQFQTIGKEYRKLYEHMAAGASSLCDKGLADERLNFPSVELLTSDETERDASAVAATAPADFAPAESSDQPDSIPEVTEVEPSDDELRATEAREELLAEQELGPRPGEAGKTYH
jgi:uncharacterized membrane-anchored protein YhcB (DUF1043 family)